MDYNPMMTGAPPRQRSGSQGAADKLPQGENIDMNATIQSQLGHMVWEAGSRQMKETFSSYGRIDIFRPYFDVEPIQVRNRLFQSFIPRRPSQMSVTNDLYGPTMIVLTMVALLLFNMKSSGYTTQDGTLIGTALVSCFGTWIFLSVALYTLLFLLSTDVPVVNVISLFGYSMTSHCVVLLLTSLFHPQHDHVFFFGLLLLFCVPAALRMSLYLSSKTHDKSHKLLLSCCVIGMHLLYITYLHFGFHVMLEEIDEMLGDHAAAQVVKMEAPVDAAA